MMQISKEVDKVSEFSPEEMIWIVLSVVVVLYIY